MRKILTGSLTLLLWLATVALGVYEIATVREALLTLYGWIVTMGDPGPTHLRGSYWSAVLFGQVITIVFAMLMVGVVIGGGEYHAKYAGESRSWRLFAWTLGVQLLILFVTLPFA